MPKLALVFLGAGLGGVLRYLLGAWIQSLAGSGFPLGTLTVNTLGCLAMGFLACMLAGPTLSDEGYRLALIVGLLGGFTTFSAFGFETVQLLTQRQFLFAALNVALSNAFGLAGVWVGSRAAAHAQGL